MLDILALYSNYAYIFIGFLSLLVGSLLNVIIYRLPKMIMRDWKTECTKFLALENTETAQPLNLFFPNSFCPSCNQPIPFWCNIPILSYVLLRGRCRICKTKISIRYPFIEALTALLSLYATWFFGVNLTLVFVLPFLWILICMIFIDYDHQILPDSLTLGLLWLGLIANTYTLFVPIEIAVYSAAGGYLFLWAFIKLFYLVTGKIGMGNGDFKLFAAFGAWFGWTMLPLILLLSASIGACIGIIYLKTTRQNKNTPIPFGPFLCGAGIIALFYGQDILTWYLSFYVI